MTNKIFLSSLIQFLAFFIFLSFIYSCETGPGNDDDKENKKPEAAIPTELEASRHFYYGWLADCVNDISVVDIRSWAKSKILSLASARIKGAIGDEDIVKVFGGDKLVWGPDLNIVDRGIANYVSINLMYCLKSDDGSGNVNYNIGISGTNMISGYDWFREDLYVEDQQKWKAGGKISDGSMLGFDILDRMKDPNTQEKLSDFLKKELFRNPNATISVSGHSLGGALTQVYSSNLKKIFPGTTTKVVAWVYAGPTAGDSTFASHLVNDLDAYYAYNNTLDLVPHAWQNDRINELCGIYNGLLFCDLNIENNVAVNGVIKYLSDISVRGNYTMPGRPFTFTGKPYHPGSDCADLNDAIYAIYKTGYHNDIYKYLYDMTKHCNSGNPVTENELYQFFYYLAEMGIQHTSGYFDHFFKDQSEDFKNAVDTFVPGAKSTWQNILNADEGRLLLEKFLEKVKTHLEAKPIQNCDCTT